jgi:hypothetical protein
MPGTLHRIRAALRAVDTAALAHTLPPRRWLSTR